MALALPAVATAAVSGMKTITDAKTGLAITAIATAIYHGQGDSTSRGTAARLVVPLEMTQSSVTKMATVATTGSDTTVRMTAPIQPSAGTR